MSYISELRAAIRQLHGCQAYHAETVSVTESFQGEVVWQGEVEVFNLRGHPKAERAYAWAHDTDNGKRYVAVLKLPPVDSPQSAVKAAIVDEARKQKDN